MKYTVYFWASFYTGSSESFTTLKAARKALSEYIREEWTRLNRNHVLVRSGSVKDNAVTVHHKAGGRVFGGYIVAER